MRCPYGSSADTKVTDSRDTDDGASIRRRRQCLSCGRRFTTYETVEQAPLRVIKKDGTREVFNRNKLRSGLIRACEKRNITSEQIENIVDVVESLLGKGFEIKIYDRNVKISELTGTNKDLILARKFLPK